METNENELNRQTSSRADDLTSSSPETQIHRNDQGDSERLIKQKQKPHRPQGSKIHNPRYPQRTKVPRLGIQNGDVNVEGAEKKQAMSSGKKIFQEDLVINAKDEEERTAANKHAPLKTSKTIFTVSYESQSNSPDKEQDREPQDPASGEAPIEYTTAKDNNHQDLFSDTESEFDFNKYRIDTERSPKKPPNLVEAVQREENRQLAQNKDSAQFERKESPKTGIPSFVKSKEVQMTSTEKRENATNQFTRGTQETRTIFSKSYFELAAVNNND